MRVHPFPRVLRLRRRLDFVRVQDGGKRIRTSHLTACWIPSPTSERYGLTVSRRVGNSVTRNRVKRWLRESIRTCRSGQLRGDIVFIARPEAANVGYRGIRAQVELIFRRLGASAPSSSP